MIKRMKALLKKVVFSLVFCLFLFSGQKAYAQDNFDVSYHLTYQFLDNETAQISQTTILINKKTNLYPTEYEAVINGKIVSEISGFDNAGPLSVISNSEEDKTKVKVYFSQRSVGVGSELKFTLVYQLQGLVNTTGRIKEIFIPKAPIDNSLKDYDVTVLIPVSFGTVAFSKPSINFSENNNLYNFSFAKNIAQNGVIIAFGDVSHLTFSLFYHLENPLISTAKTEIALPPDTAYQQVFYSSVFPRPHNVTIDEDGNFIATYHLLPKQTLDVVASGSALIYASPREEFKTYLPTDKHLFSDKFWEVGDKQIQETAKNLQNPLEIYQFVKDKLSYSYKRVSDETERFGAKKALENPQEAICMEFTDLFIALCRASSIYAREANGYAYTTDSYLKPLSLVIDLLHAWPEYFDQEKQSWIAVDPTWGNTTYGLDFFHSFDFNHFTFAYHGVSSTYPYAAGSYKKEGKGKDIEITFEDDLPIIPENNYSFTLSFPQKIIAGKSKTIKITLENNQGKALYDLPITIKALNFTFDLPYHKITLAPYAKTEIKATITHLSKKFWGKEEISVFIGDQEQKTVVEITPMELIFLPLIILIFIILALATYAKFKKQLSKKRNK